MASADVSVMLEARRLGMVGCALLPFACAALVACSSSQAKVTTADDAGTSQSEDAGIDAAVDAGPYVNPLANVAFNQSWTFVPFPDAVCADGTPTGIGVNFTSPTSDLAIYFNGGGACWDQATCSAGCATNLTTGYDETHGTPAWSTFATPATFAGTVFDRSDANNPIRSYNYVHIFYCTADTHAGSRIADYTIMGRDGQPHPVHHVGFENLQSYLKALSATFKPQHVFLSGSSAGGYASYLDYDVVARTFPSAPVYMVDDSGPYLESSYTPPGNDVIGPAWNINAAIPAGCTDCAGSAGLTALAPYISKTYPNGRMALVSSTQDGHIRQRYSLDGPGFTTAITSLATDVLDPLPNWRTFYMAGDTHTALLNTIARDTSCGRGIPSVTTPPGTNCGQSLEAFLNAEINDPLSAWTSATPPAGVPGASEVPTNDTACAIGK